MVDQAAFLSLSRKPHLSFISSMVAVLPFSCDQCNLWCDSNSQLTAHLLGPEAMFGCLLQPGEGISHKPATHHYQHITAQQGDLLLINLPSTGSAAFCHLVSQLTLSNSVVFWAKHIPSLMPAHFMHICTVQVLREGFQKTKCKKMHRQFTLGGGV